MRRKFYTRLTDQFGSTPDPTPTAYPMLPGARVRTGVTISAGGNAVVEIASPGAIRSSDSLVRWNGASTVTGLSAASNPTYSSGWRVTVSNSTGGDIALSAGDYLVFPSSSSSKRAPWYVSDTAGTPSTSALPVGTYGAVSFYTNSSDVDLVVIQSGSTYYFVDLPTDTRNVVTPEEFGALGDGSSDDTYAIEQAMQHVLSEDGTGVVLLSNKVYRVTGLSLPSAAQLTLQGSGVADTSTLGASGTTLLVKENNAAISTTAVTGTLTIRDMLLYNDQSSATPSNAGASGLRIAGSGSGLRVLADNVRIEGFFHGIWGNDDNVNCHFNRVIVRNSVAGGIISPRNSKYTDCQSLLNGSTHAHHGLQMGNDCEEIQITGGEFSNNAGSGIFADSAVGVAPETVMITNVLCQSNGTDGSSNPAAGIYLKTSLGGQFLENVVINGAVCKSTVNASGTRRPGILLQQVRNANVNAVCENNAGGGVYVEDSAYVNLNVTCRLNYASTNTDAGITLDNTDYSTVRGVISGSGGAGVLLLSSNLNTVTGVVSTGNGVNDTVTAQVEVQGCQKTTITGVMADGSTGSGCQHGIWLNATSSTNTVVGCLCRLSNGGNNFQDDSAGSEKGHNSFSTES